MAIGGRVTAAYRCQVVDGWLQVQYAATQRSLCAQSVDVALERLQAGELVTVAGSDMPALRTRLAGLGIG